MDFLSCDSNKLPATEHDLGGNNRPAGTEQLLHCLCLISLVGIQNS